MSQLSSPPITLAVLVICNVLIEGPIFWVSRDSFPSVTLLSSHMLFGLKNQSGGRSLILQRNCILKNILVRSINVSLWVIELAKKRVPIWTFLSKFRGNFGIKNQSRGRPSILQRDCILKNILFWCITVSLWVIELAKKRVPIWTFTSKFRGKFWAQKSI
jgi:hypothetical protein